MIKRILTAIIARMSEEKFLVEQHEIRKSHLSVAAHDSSLGARWQHSPGGTN